MALTDEELAGLEPRELLQLGIDLFNAGRYFDAHEAWEEVWMGSEHPMRAFYQGLIQVAAAFVHLTRNEYPGTEKLLEEGLAKLEKYQPDFLTVEVATLVREASATRARVIDLGPKRLRDVDQASLPRIEQQALPASRFHEGGGSLLHCLEWSRTDGAVDSSFDRLRTNGQEDRTAKGQLVVLLHAPGYVAHIWQPVAARLAAAGFRVLAPDLPGHGLSEAGRGNVDADIELLSRWLTEVAKKASAIVSVGQSAGLAARLAPAIEGAEVYMAPKEALGLGDGEAFGLRRRVWPSRWEMFRTLHARAQFARWRPDLLWTYVEDGTELLEPQSASARPDVQLRCRDETELRFLEMGRLVDGAMEIEASPLVQPVEAAEKLVEVLDGLSSRAS